MRILPGLPPYGPTAVPFPASGQGRHRVGLVVEIDDPQGDTWTGNFQRGGMPFDAAFVTFAIDRPVIIAGGAGYLVDAPTHAELATFGGDINWADSRRLPPHAVPRKDSAAATIARYPWPRFLSFFFFIFFRKPSAPAGAPASGRLPA
jgi:hypothetical protein